MKSKFFNTASYLLALVLIMPNLFTFCSSTRYEEKPPSFSDKKLSEWHKIRTTNFENVVFVAPKNIPDLVAKINMVIENKELRCKIIRNGFLLANNNTTEIQTKNMIKIIDQLLIEN